MFMVTVPPIDMMGELATSSPDIGCACCDEHDAEPIGSDGLATAPEPPEPPMTMPPMAVAAFSLAATGYVALSAIAAPKPAKPRTAAAGDRCSSTVAGACHSVRAGTTVGT